MNREVIFVRVGRPLHQAVKIMAKQRGESVSRFVSALLHKQAMQEYDARQAMRMVAESEDGKNER